MYIKNRQSNDFTMIKLNANFIHSLQELSRKIDWEPVYSDAYTLKNNKYQKYRLNIWQFFMLFFFSHKYQIKMPNNMVWYPFATRKGNLSFSYRSNNGFTLSMRHKQFLATIVAGIVNVIIPFKRPKLVFEKLSDRAQESGYAYFKYVQKYYPKEKLYFLIKESSPDFFKIKQMDNIVIHGSFFHFYMLHRANFFISSETPGHAYFWRENMGITANIVRTKPYVFLQHGVLGFKRLDSIFYGDRLTSPTLLITSSEFEKKIVTSKLGFDEERVPVTGLARWDMIDLYRERKTSRDKILIFYTWRPWLDDVDDKRFHDSQYFKHLREVLTVLNDHYLDKQIVIMLHPKLHAALDNKLLKHIKLWTDDNGPLNELLSSVSVIITDYSSISWEAYYREVPVIFDMFDQEKYISKVGSYIDLDALPFGSKVTDNKTLLDALLEVKDNDYRLTAEELENKTNFFAYQDNKASERIHKAVQLIDMRSIKRSKNRALISAAMRMLKR